MDSAENIEIVGRKTFFIEPNRTLLEENYLQRLVGSGYECYIIKNSVPSSFKKKIEGIIGLFPEAVLIFNVEAKMQGVEWLSYIKELRNKQKSLLIGVMASKDFIKTLDSSYKVYANAGILTLEGNAGDYDRVKELLHNAKASGRRTMVRAKCDDKSVFALNKNNKTYNARIFDINASYFSCSFAEGEIPFNLYEHFNNLQLIINGMKLETSAALVMKTVRKGAYLYIFMFTKPDGTTELEESTKNLLLQKVYQMVTLEGNRIMAQVLSD